MYKKYICSISTLSQLLSGYRIFLNSTYIYIYKLKLNFFSSSNVIGFGGAGLSNWLVRFTILLSWFIGGNLPAIAAST
jgi:hypothetical protein